MSNHKKGMRAVFASAYDALRRKRTVAAVYFTLRFLVIAVMVAQFFNGDFESVFLCALTLVLFLLPTVFERALMIDLPNTLEIVVTEREIAAVVDVVADNAKTTQHWAIASDGMWLMEIPDQDSELGQSISPQIYEDAGKVLHIKDVPFGLTPEVGTYCTDENVNNALKILDGLSTALADQVKTVSATDAQSTLLTLDNGIQIAFGTADDIRDKERICLEIMDKNQGKVAYINVRVPDRPTWRAV